MCEWTVCKTQCAHFEYTTVSPWDDIFIHRQLEFTIPQDIDAEQLDCPLIPIPKEDLWPPFTDHLTLAPYPLPSDIFFKKPSLIGLGSETGPKPREVLLHEAHMCEILRRHPHPNIASYLGCVRDKGLITGLCFVRYKETLSDRLRDSNRPLNLHSCLKGVKNGLDHLHDLGLYHNYINLANIMLDKEDVSFGNVYHSAPIRAV